MKIFKNFSIFPNPYQLGPMLLIWPFVWGFISNTDISTRFWDDFILFSFGYIAGVFYFHMHKGLKKENS